MTLLQDFRYSATCPSILALATEPILVAIILSGTRRTRITPTLLLGLLLELFDVALSLVANRKRRDAKF